MKLPNKHEYLAKVPLLDGQRQIVLDTMRTGNTHAAAVEDGVIKANRINFFQDIINRPGILRHGVAQLIPFTSWNVEAMTRYLSHGTSERKNNNLKWLLAKRIAIPTIVLGTLEAATQSDFITQHPAWSVVGLANPRLNPMVTSIVDDFIRNKGVRAGQNALKWFPLTNALFVKPKQLKEKETRKLLGVPKSRFIKE